MASNQSTLHRSNVCWVGFSLLKVRGDSPFSVHGDPDLTGHILYVWPLSSSRIEVKFAPMPDGVLTTTAIRPASWAIDRFGEGF